VKVKIVGQKKNPQEQLPQIVNRIFSICKTDPNFPLKNELEDVDYRVTELEQKIAKQDDLLKQSAELKKDFIHRIEGLDDSNSRIQIQLLESLGSEL
jgi:hypothetical protein